MNPFPSLGEGWPPPPPGARFKIGPIGRAFIKNACRKIDRMILDAIVNPVKPIKTRVMIEALNKDLEKVIKRGKP